MKAYLIFLSRNKYYTAVTVVGLVVSLMFIILMGDYTWRQYSIDRWHRHADRICLLGSNDSFFMWPQLAGEVSEMCPEVESTCCVMSQSGRIKYGNQEVKGQQSDEAIIMLTDPTFFWFFDFPLLQGDPQTVLDAPDKCVVTERLARTLFGDKSPIGQSLQVVGNRNVRTSNADPYDSTLVYTVSGVVRDIDRTVLPNETQLIISMERFPQVMGYTLTNDSYAYGPTGACKDFLMLRPGTTLDGKKKTIEDHLTRNYMLWSRWGENELTLTPLTDIMFAPQNDGYGMQRGDRTRLRILLAAVLAILFFAVSNYINLTVANTGFRAKEMATRRLFGSSQLGITLKLMGESMLMVAVCFAAGLWLAFCFQDEAAALFKGKIALGSDVSPGSVGVCLAFIVLVGIVAGLLPSWQIARYQPIDIVKGNFRFRSKMVVGRVFIIVQNIITVVMLVCVFVIWLQLSHLIHAPLGFNTEHLYYVNTPAGKSQTVRSQLEQLTCVEAIGEISGTTFSNYNSRMRTVTAGGKMVSLMLTDLDSTALSLYGLEILKDYGHTDGGYYLNEEAMRRWGFGDDDREMAWGEGETVPIAGVIKDFHRINVLQDAEPFAIRLQEHVEEPDYLVRTTGDKTAKAAFTDIIRSLGVAEDDLSWYVSSVEDNIAETFDEQQNLLRIVVLFALVAIVISVMGFVGMSLFFIRQRKKEIAIRKVMGSTSGEVLVLMLRMFCGPVLLSFVVAVPVAWFVMHDWLSSFGCRIALSPWIFAVVCMFNLVVAVLSVGYQIVRAVRMNPVLGIKTE